jgi:hypothetical protein
MKPLHVFRLFALAAGLLAAPATFAGPDRTAICRAIPPGDPPQANAPGAQTDAAAVIVVAQPLPPLSLEGTAAARPWSWNRHNFDFAAGSTFWKIDAIAE